MNIPQKNTNENNVVRKSHQVQRSKASPKPGFLAHLPQIMNSKGENGEKDPNNDFFKKIASRKSLSNQDENNAYNESLFDFYVFNLNCENYETVIKLKFPLTGEMVNSALTKFHNGLTLIILKKILKFLDDDFIDFQFKRAQIIKNSQILFKMIHEIDDKFALSLLQREQYHDLQNYLSVYLFSSTVYQKKILKFIEKIFKKKFLVDKGNLLNSKEVDLKSMMEELGKNNDMEKMLAFVYIQILEELSIQMDIYSSFIQTNEEKKVKTKLYNSCNNDDPEFILILLKLKNDFSLCFGNKVTLGTISEEFSSRGTFKSAFSKLRKSSEEFWEKTEFLSQEDNRASSVQKNNDFFLKKENIEKIFDKGNTLKKDSKIHFATIDSGDNKSIFKSSKKRRAESNNFINIEENFFRGKDYEKMVSKVGGSMKHFQVTPLRYEGNQSFQGLITMSDDKFLQKKISDVHKEDKSKKLVQKSEAKFKRSFKKTNSINDIQEKIEELKSKANQKILNDKRNKSNNSKLFESNDSSNHKKKGKIPLNLVKKKLKFANTESILDKIKEKRRNDYLNSERAKTTRKSLKSDINLFGNIKTEREKSENELPSIREKKLKEFSSSQEKKNEINELTKTPENNFRGEYVIKEEKGDFDKKGYYTDSNKKRKDFDRIDEMIKENNMAITAVLKKFEMESNSRINVKKNYIKKKLFYYKFQFLSLKNIKKIMT